ncbi:sirohydrochlorin chelatase [Arthrobacter sp. SA17]
MRIQWISKGGRGGSNVTLALMKNPILIACSHGTSNAQGAAEVNALRDEIAALRPGLDVRESYVDVQQPDLVDVVAALPEGEPAVVVPLLLSVGYHVKVDIARAVKSRPETLAAAPLGPDPRLAALLDQRLREAGVTDRDAVVLAAAGSSNPNAARSVEELADQLRELRPNRIVPAYGASAQPSVPDAVAMLRTEAAGGAGAGSPPVPWTTAAAWLLRPTSWRRATSMTSWPRRKPIW